MYIDAVKCDTQTSHELGFFHEHTNNPHWIIMCFQTPFSYLKDGKMYEGKPGDCLINAPNTYVKHGPTPDMNIGFQHDWLYFSGDGIEDFIDKHNLPINMHFGIGNPSFLTSYIQNIMYEKLNKQPFYEEKISMIVQNVLTDAARSLALRPSPFLKHNEIFNEIRNKIFKTSEDDWTLEKMAILSGYSISRFCYLYKKQFKVSPSSDLLHMRIQKSKNLLSYSDFTIEQVAMKSGFTSGHHFSYTFKKIAGTTPTEYRNKNKFFK